MDWEKINSDAFLTDEQGEITAEPNDVQVLEKTESRSDNYETSQNVDKSSELMTGKLFWKTPFLQVDPI